MALCAIVADDLTGANTTGVLLAKAGLKILTMVCADEFDHLDYQNYDGIVVNVISRGMNRAEAYQAVKQSTQALVNLGAKHFSKRIDSTIRGNLGGEIEGMLSVLTEETVAIVVPSYPASGKICIGGCLLVDAVPVDRTAAGKDTIKPVCNSYLPNAIAEQTDLPIGLIPYAVISAGQNAIVEALHRQRVQKNRIIVIDTASQMDIEIVAKAVFASCIPNITVDPGPFTQALFSIYKDISKPLACSGKVMVVGGSVSETTRLQLGYLQTECHAGLLGLDVSGFLDRIIDDELAEAIACKVYALSEQYDIFGIRVGENANLVLDIYMEAKTRNQSVDEISSRITLSLGKIAWYTLGKMKCPLKGVYLTGGDATVSFCKAMKAQAIEMEDEIIPHVTYGNLKGGCYDGLKIATKGGLIGKKDTAYECIQYMMNK